MTTSTSTVKLSNHTTSAHFENLQYFPLQIWYNLPQEDDLTLPPIDYEEILKNERATYEQLRSKEEAKKLETMSQQGQVLFTELKKLYEATIVGQDLVLKEFNIKIKPPYRADDLEGGEDKGRDRLKEIVQHLPLLSSIVLD